MFLAIDSTPLCYTEQIWIIAANSEDQAREMVRELGGPDILTLVILSVSVSDITEPRLILATGCNP